MDLFCWTLFNQLWLDSLKLEIVFLKNALLVLSYIDWNVPWYWCICPEYVIFSHLLFSCWFATFPLVLWRICGFFLLIFHPLRLYGRMPWLMHLDLCSKSGYIYVLFIIGFRSWHHILLISNLAKVYLLIFVWFLSRKLQYISISGTIPSHS